MNARFANEQVADICRALGLSGEATQKAQAIAERVDYEYPINRSPSVVAASSVYIAGLLVNEKRVQHEIADAAGVSEGSIRDAYPEICDHEGIPIDRSQGKDTQPRRGIRHLAEVKKRLFRQGGGDR